MMRLKDSASLLSEAIVAFVWRQWSQLGGAGYVATADAWVADPEWLWAFSQQVAPHDGRLDDLLQAWHRRNGHLLMPQRLKVAMAAWPQLASEGPRSEAPQVPPRWQHQVADKASAPPLDEVAALAFRLRLALGVGVKAEAVRLLLAAGPQGLSSGEVVQGVGLSRSAVWRALEELDALGLVMRHQSGPKRQRWVATQARWWPWLGWPAQSPWPAHVPWPAFYQGLMPLWRWAVDGQRDGESPLVATLAARKAMADCLAHWPLAVGIRPSLPDGHLGEAYLVVFAEDVAALASWLQGSLPFNTSASVG